MSFGTAIADYYIRRAAIGLVLAMLGAVALFEGGRYLLHHLDVYVLWN